MTFLLAFLADWSFDDELTYVILLGQVEELADLARTFWPKTTGHIFVGQARNFLNKKKSKHCKIQLIAADDCS